MAPEDNLPISGAAHNGTVPAPQNNRPGSEPCLAGRDALASSETSATSPANAHGRAGQDPYDPALLGLSQDFAAESGVAKRWSTIRVEKPNSTRVFRVRSDYRLKTLLLTLQDTGETYLVLPELHQALWDCKFCRISTLFACVTRDGTPFLWPIPMAPRNGKWSEWHRSAWDIALKAQYAWTRVESAISKYVGFHDGRPPEQQQQPVWPDLEFRDWLELAFQHFRIDSLDHPVLKRLRLED